MEMETRESKTLDKGLRHLLRLLLEWFQVICVPPHHDPESVKQDDTRISKISPTSLADNKSHCRWQQASGNVNHQTNLGIRTDLLRPTRVTGMTALAAFLLLLGLMHDLLAEVEVSRKFSHLAIRLLRLHCTGSSAKLRF